MEFDLVISEEMGRNIREAVFSMKGREGWTFGLSRAIRAGNSVRFIMAGASSVDKEDYDCRTAAGLTLTAEASSRFNLVSAEAARFGFVPTHIHSHPAGVPDFSGHDDHAELELHNWLRTQGQPWLLSVVMSQGDAPRARLWRNGRPWVCGLRIGLRRWRRSREEKQENAAPLLTFDRQRAFGPGLAQAAPRLKIGIIGTGGIGMPVAEMLARSGFTDFVLIDPDYVEEVNLNRLGHAYQRDVGRPKVNLCRSVILRACAAAGTKATVRAFREDVNLLSKGAEKILAQCDVILALTDDELSRITCLKFAQENGIEYLQAGVGIFQEKGRITTAAVEFTGAELGRYCPICTGRLSPAQASIDARRYVGGDVAERAHVEGYIPEEPAPSVMSLNAVAAGALVLEIQKRVAGLSRPVDLWQHDFLNGKTLFEQGIEEKLDGSCWVCGRN